MKKTGPSNRIESAYLNSPRCPFVRICRPELACPMLAETLESHRLVLVRRSKLHESDGQDGLKHSRWFVGVADTTEFRTRNSSESLDEATCSASLIRSAVGSSRASNILS